MQAHRKSYHWLLGAALALACVFPSLAAAQPVTLHATLILASDEPAAQDPRLDKIEFKLRRIFGFEYYSHYGEAAVGLDMPGDTALSLGHGYRLEVSASEARQGHVRAVVRWLRGEDIVLNTTVVMARGVPIILGGISHDKGTLIVTLVAK